MARCGYLVFFSLVPNFQSFYLFKIPTKNENASIRLTLKVNIKEKKDKTRRNFETNSSVTPQVTVNVVSS